METSTDSHADGTFSSPFSDAQVRDAIAALDIGRLDTPAAREFGVALFTALVRDGVKSLYESSNAGAQGQVTIRLVIDDPAVARIPWELIVDPDIDELLTTRGRFVRGFSTKVPAQPITTEPPLRVLVAESSPAGVPRLETQLEVDDIQVALKELTDIGRVVVETLTDASIESLQNRLRERARANPPTPIHVVHWIGHGGIDPATGIAVLLFEQEGKRRDPVDGGQLATILNGYSIRLVFLNACYSVAPAAIAPTTETARTESSFGLTSGVAEALLNVGIPGRDRDAGHGRRRSSPPDRRRVLSVDRRRVRGRSGDPGRAAAGPAGHRRKRLRRRHPGRVSTGRLDAPARAGRSENRSPRSVRPSQHVARSVRDRREGRQGRRRRPVRHSRARCDLLGYSILQGPPRLGGEFNVVVAEFLGTDSSGRTVGNEVASALSENVFEALKGELVANPGLPIVQMLGPDQAGKVNGSTPRERAAAAANLAAKTNAHLADLRRPRPDRHESPA